MFVIYEGFSNLNYRFQQLINSSSILFKSKVNHSTSEEIFINKYKPIILRNKYKILSIHSLTFKDDNQTISSFNIDSSFIHLQSFVISSIEPKILRLLLPKLTSLPRLISLSIDTWYTLKDVTDIYQFIFQLPKLKYMKFSAMKSEDSSITVSLPIATDKQFSLIEYLVIHHLCTFNEFFSIISHTPHLHRLNLLDITNNDSNIRILSPIALANLTSIYMNPYYVTFNQFEIFITKLPSKLKVLSFRTLSKDMTYLDANRWEELILKYLLNLEKFYLEYSVYFDNKYEAPICPGQKDKFISPFWIDRQWIFEAAIEDEITYSIRPYKYVYKKIF